MIYDSPAQADTALIIDLSNLAYRAYYGNSELKTKDGRLSGHVHGSANILQAIFRDLGKSICPIFCYDGENAKEERQKILPEYKGNREKREINVIEGVREFCQYLPGLHIEEEGREGDDAIAYACKLCASKDIVIYSGDRDLLALTASPNVKVYNPNKGRLVEAADIYENYHVFEPSKIPVAKAIFGDPSDNIKGVERLIKKQIEPILNDPKCVDINAFYDMIQEKPSSMTDKMWAKTKDAESKVKINYQVILPNLTNFSKTSVKRIFKAQENRDKLMGVLKSYECYAVLDRMGAIYE